MTSRREFLGTTAASAAGLWLPGEPLPPTPAPTGFLDLRRPPDAVMVQAATDYWSLVSSGGGQWAGHGIAVTTEERENALHVTLHAPAVAVSRVHLRWRGSLSPTRLILGDAWERGYGDLEWRGWAPDRVMPWYAATTNGATTNAYGVRTGARAFCFWQIDPDGISLWTDVRSGGIAINLGERTLDVCDVVCRAGRPGEA